METFAVDKSFYEIGPPELKDIWDSDLDSSMHDVLRVGICPSSTSSSDLLPSEWNFLERELPLVLHDRLMTDAALGTMGAASNNTTASSFIYSSTTRPIKHEHSYSLSSDGDSNPHSPSSHHGHHMDDDMDVDCFRSINPANVKLQPEDDMDDIKEEPYSETDSVHSSCPSSPQDDDEYLNGPCENVDVDEYFADIDNIRRTLKQTPTSLTTSYILTNPVTGTSTAPNTAAPPTAFLQLDMLGHLTTTTTSSSSTSPTSNAPSPSSSNNSTNSSFQLPPTPPSCSSGEEGEDTVAPPIMGAAMSGAQASVRSGRLVQQQGGTRVVVANGGGGTRQPIHTPLISSQPKGSTGNLMLTEEEKRTLLAEGYPVPTRLPLTKSEEKSLKKIRRKIKNKISAQESRRKKKEYMDQLERKVDVLVSENNDYKKKLESLENSNTNLLNQLAKLQAIVTRGHPYLMKK